MEVQGPLDAPLGVEYDAKKGSVALTTVDHQTLTFKAINSGDVVLVEQQLETLRMNPAPSAVKEAVAALGLAGSSVLNLQGTMPEDHKAAKQAYKQGLKEHKAEAKAAARDAAEAKRAAAREVAGDLVLSDTFSTKTVEIYQNGFVRVGGLLGVMPDTPYERLLSIEATSDVTKKTAVGRGIGAVATGGINLAFTNKRGDVYLVIVTDRTTRALHVEAPNKWDLTSSKKLEAAGNAVIAQAEAAAATGDAAAAPSPPEGAALDVPEKLRQLNTMRDEGLVTDDEFVRLRADVLKSI